MISCSSTRLVAAMMRTFTWRVRVEPTGMNSRSWRTRSSLVWMIGVSSPISSRKAVPRSACWNSPALSAMAPVNEPLTWPNSSLSRRLSGMALQVMGTKGLAATRERLWMARATSSLPVPDSP